MNHRSRSHHAGHVDNDQRLDVPEMELVHRGQPVLVTTNEHLAALIETLRNDETFAYDSEFITERSYHPQLCLVQVASRAALALIDPLAALDMTQFWELLADPSVTKIVHAGDSDVEPVVRHLGRPAANVFDTQISAGFIGLPYPMSLMKLVFELTGVHLGRDLGFSNWQQRPLSPSQIRYAADDVRYLPAAHKEMVVRLRALGHLRAAEEECAAACEIGRFGFNPQTQYRRVRGSAALSSRSQAVLKELTTWRDGAARRQDKPPRTFLKDEVLVEMARDCPGSIAELEQVRTLPRSIANEFGADIVAAAVKARSLSENDLPAPEPELSATDGLHVDALGAMLQRLCAESSLDQGLVASRKELRRFYQHVVYGIGDTPALLQGWRRAAIGETLKSFTENNEPPRDASTPNAV